MAPRKLYNPSMGQMCGSGLLAKKVKNTERHTFVLGRVKVNSVNQLRPYQAM